MISPQGPYIGLQQDGLESQNGKPIRGRYWGNNIFVVRTPGQCTDVCAMIDDEIGHNFKNTINDLLWGEIAEKQDLRCFLNEKLSESDKRILMCIYAKKAWDITKQKSGLIKKVAKRMGFYNCRCGCENHLVRVGRVVDYKVPTFGTPLVEKMSLEDSYRAQRENARKRKELKGKK